MIILSQALRLSAATLPYPLSHPIIGYQNVVAKAAVSADGAASGYPASNVATTNTAEFWRSDDTSEQYLTILTGTADEVDYIGVARHNFGSAAIAVTVEGQADYDGEWSELVEEIMLADDTPVLFRFTSQPLYSIRLKLASGDVAPQAAVVYVGALLVMERSFPVTSPFTPFPLGSVVDSVVGRALKGNYMGALTLFEGQESSVSFEHLTEDFYRDSVAPFLVAAKTKPFFFAWNPQAHPRDVGFAWFPRGVNPQPRIDPVTDRYHIDFDMVGFAA